MRRITRRLRGVVARRYMGRLVPARAEQLCGRRSAEQRNELAASKFIEFHSIPSRHTLLMEQR